MCVCLEREREREDLTLYRQLVTFENYCFYIILEAESKQADITTRMHISYLLLGLIQLCQL